jgi:protein-L-isoaspartate(D-aspartate) O-methyltransferase
MPDFATARRSMVDTQLRTYDVTSHRVLAAFEAVPREVFLPSNLADLAYADGAFAAEAGSVRRVMLQPMVLGRLLQALAVEPGETALDCAGGSGYGAALLSTLGARVTAVEEGDTMTALMRDALSRGRIAGIDVRSGDLASAAGATGPFDVILVHGAVEIEPTGLLALLGEGGRLGVVIGTGRAGRAVVYSKAGGVIGQRVVFDASVPPLAAFRQAPAFSL